MKRQIPRGDENLICPLHKKSMDLVCHKCPWWLQVRGRNPNNGEEVDHWNCSIAFLPLLQIDTSNHVRQADATIQAMRNEAKEAHDQNITIGAIAVQRSRDAVRDTFVEDVVPLIHGHGPLMIEGK